MKDVFNTLVNIDISNLVLKKGNFFYLSWAQAVRVVSKVYPSMTWEIHKFDGLPFLKTELGYFVEASVTIEGMTKSQLMPVLDFKNQTHKNPTAFDINKSQQRALAKAISLHGLGIELWAGEDLEKGSEQQEVEVDENLIGDLTEQLNACDNLESLKQVFMSLPKHIKPHLEQAKNEVKSRLSQ